MIDYGCSPLFLELFSIILYWFLIREMFEKIEMISSSQKQWIKRAWPANQTFQISHFSWKLGWFSTEISGFDAFWAVLRLKNEFWTYFGAFLISFSALNLLKSIWNFEKCEIWNVCGQRSRVSLWVSLCVIFQTSDLEILVFLNGREPFLAI